MVIRKTFVDYRAILPQKRFKNKENEHRKQ